MIGMLAFSKAGHDKMQIFMIVGDDGESVYLCDGRLRTLKHPKKKNKKHIQLIKSGIDLSIQKKLQQHQTVHDEEIKRVIKDYHRLKEVSDV
ncbi:MAG TPA: hypothetical protein VJY54_08100 [Lachnospiraceae bacterium]|nr:hypothetical protein [Lachnospiraceae bacterium]